MKISEIYGHLADRVTLVVKQPFSDKELSIDELECLLDSLTVFLGGLLAEQRAKETK
jgi:hypothetical protein